MRAIILVVKALMILFGVIALYALFFAGKPDSLLRPLFPDPEMDAYVSLGASFLVFALGFIIFFQKDQSGFRRLVEINGDQIRKLRAAGRSEEEIVQSILAAMGSRSGYRHHMARKKLLLYMSEFE